MNKLLKLTLPAVLLCLFVSGALATAPSQLKGQVTSLKGKISEVRDYVMAGLTVTARNKATGKEYQAISDSTGAFEFQNVEPGTYVVDAQCPGLEHIIGAAEVEPGKTAELNLLALPLQETGNTAVDKFIASSAAARRELPGRQHQLSKRQRCAGHLFHVGLLRHSWFAVGLRGLSLSADVSFSSLSETYAKTQIAIRSRPPSARHRPVAAIQRDVCSRADHRSGRQARVPARAARDSGAGRLDRRHGSDRIGRRQKVFRSGLRYRLSPSRRPRRLQSGRARGGIGEVVRRVDSDLRRRLRAAPRLHSTDGRLTSPTSESGWCRCAGATSTPTTRC